MGYTKILLASQSKSGAKGKKNSPSRGGKTEQPKPNTGSRGENFKKFAMFCFIVFVFFIFYTECTNALTRFYIGSAITATGIYTSTRYIYNLANASQSLNNLKIFKALVT